MKVLKKQTNSKMCIVCGMDNPAGLHAPFYEMEDHTVVTIFKYGDIHQSYPERAHGGLITTMLDELIGRALWIDEPDVWGVTATLNVKFRKPVALNETIKGVGKITENKSRIFKGIGKLYNEAGEVIAEAEAVYVKLPLDKVVSTHEHDSEINIYIPDDVKEIK